MGTCLIQAQNAVQTVLSEQDIPIGITVISFAQFLGGAIFVPVCQAVLTNTLTSRLNSEIPDLDTTQLAKTGATNISGLVPEAQLPILLAAYNQGIVYTFFVALGMACVALIASFFLEWKSMKKQSVRAETAAP